MQPNPTTGSATRDQIAAHYGYDKYGGNCHMVPNHGLIIHSLLHGEGDFQKSLMIVNTCGWDTDCNSGNVGCLLGIRGGLAAIEAGADFRTPVADRMYLATADGGRAITDAVTETFTWSTPAARWPARNPSRPRTALASTLTCPAPCRASCSTTARTRKGLPSSKTVKATASTAAAAWPSASMA